MESVCLSKKYAKSKLSSHLSNNFIRRLQCREVRNKLCVVLCVYCISCLCQFGLKVYRLLLGNRNNCISSDRRPETKQGIEGKIVRFRSGRVRVRDN